MNDTDSSEYIAYYHVPNAGGPCSLVEPRASRMRESSCVYDTRSIRYDNAMTSVCYK